MMHDSVPGSIAARFIIVVLALFLRPFPAPAQGTPDGIVFTRPGSITPTDTLPERKFCLYGTGSFGRLSRSQSGPGGVTRGELGYGLGAEYAFSRWFTVGLELAERRFAGKNPETGFGEDKTVSVSLNTHVSPFRSLPVFLTAGIGSAMAEYTNMPGEQPSGLALRLGAGYEFILDERISLLPSITSTWISINDFPGSSPAISARRENYLSLNIAAARWLPGPIPRSPAGTPDPDARRGLVFALGYTHFDPSWDPMQGHASLALGGWIAVAGGPIVIESVLKLSLDRGGSDTIPSRVMPVAVSGPLEKTGYPARQVAMVTGDASDNTPKSFAVELQTGLRRELGLWDTPYSIIVGTGISAIQVFRRPPNMQSDDATAAGLYGRLTILRNVTIGEDRVGLGVMIEKEVSTTMHLNNSDYSVNSIGIHCIAEIRL